MDTDWGELDYLIFDLPPGTSDIHLTLVQTLPVTGAIIVSTPQNIALADAIKGIMMFKNEPISVPILGIIENMSWFAPIESPDKKQYIFGKDGCKRLAKEFNVPLLGQIPLIQSIREGGDQGKPASLDSSTTGKAFKELAKKVQINTEERNLNSDPTKVVELVKK
jgi:ATP-binding protein involved in chromosome partitioning